jgi:hypothetical protein
MSIVLSYKMADNPPAPMEWDVYAEKVMKEWADLLSATPPKPEKDFQAFLERHPSMVPGATWTPGAGRSGHDPVPPVLISQPPLNGLLKHIPDFMWIAKDSMSLSPVFIEIERPDKRWFTDDGHQTAEFTQAVNQINEWKSWIKDPAHILLFRDYYDIDNLDFHRLEFNPQYILIYGSRSEFDGKDHLNKLRGSRRMPDEDFRTFDSLYPDSRLSEMLCVRMQGPRSYHAITWPPVATLSPNYAPSRAIIRDKDVAIKGCDWISNERRDFLLGRLPYWESWVKDGAKGPIRFSDRE